MPTKTIPAPIARLLRSGAYMTLSLAADDISEIAASSERATPQTRTAFERQLARFDRARALLDLLGWQDTHRAVTLDAPLDLEPHREEFSEAVALAIEHEQPDDDTKTNLLVFR
jgi:hypothetical protein